MPGLRLVIFPIRSKGHQGDRAALNLTTQANTYLKEKRQSPKSENLGAGEDYQCRHISLLCIRSLSGGNAGEHWTAHCCLRIQLPSPANLDSRANEVGLLMRVASGDLGGFGWFSTGSE